MVRVAITMVLAVAISIGVSNLILAALKIRRPLNHVRPLGLGDLWSPDPGVRRYASARLLSLASAYLISFATILLVAGLLNI
jgi:hypothetical protein